MAHFLGLNKIFDINDRSLSDLMSEVEKLQARKKKRKMRGPEYIE